MTLLINKKAYTELIQQDLEILNKNCKDSPELDHMRLVLCNSIDMHYPEIVEAKKPIHAKPSYYAIMFEPLKTIALKYGYNLVLHGSLNRDLDLIAIPWQEQIGDINTMINEFCDYVGGELNDDCTKETFHRRKHYVIDIYRGGYTQGSGFSRLTYSKDPETYIDISVMLP